MRVGLALLIVVLVSMAVLPSGKAADVQLKDIVAVLDFRNADRAVTDGEANYITELMRTEALKMLPLDKYKLMTKENIEEMLPPEINNLAECEGECEVETGRLLGSDYLVTGEIVRFGGELRVTVRLYDVKSGALLESRKVGGKNPLELEKPIENIAPVLFAVLPDARKQPGSMSAAETRTVAPARETTSPTAPTKPDPEFEKLVHQEQARLEAERRVAEERRTKLKADYQKVKEIHENTGYSEKAKNAAYQKFIDKWPDDAVYTDEVERWLAGDGLGSDGQAWGDASTGLMWQVLPTGGELDWQAAKSHCADLSLGGYRDWRLPTISELRSLVRGCPATQVGGACGVTDSCLNRSCLNYACNGCSAESGPGEDGAFWPAELGGDVDLYWSSSAAPTDSNESYCVQFYTGAVDPKNLDNGRYVRCVRKK